MTAPPTPDPDPFRVDVAPQRDLVRVRPVGELDLATAAELDAQLRELMDAGFRNILLDLSELTFMGATGVRLILELDTLARRDGLELGLVQGPEPVRRVFEICGLLDRLPFRPS